MAEVRRKIRFMLGGEVRELADVDPTMTVLQYLRRDAGRTGTKEGCAEGDCGACTVVLGEIDGNQLTYRPVNACIQFLPTIDGKQLITVEDLKNEDGSLHPVQEALVECHGSQCGFCTPGFVMSMFALYHEDAKADRGGALDAIAGNLCRCTGYGPIIEAVTKSCRGKAGDAFARGKAKTLKTLKKIAPRDDLDLEGAGRRWLAPASLDELARLAKRHPTAHVVAGLTDVGLWVTKFHRDLPVLISLSNVAELRKIKRRASRLEIGAGVTWSEARDTLGECYPGMDALVSRFASRQIRNSATIGGNIANGSPIGDGPPALIALGATVHLLKGGRARSLALEDFFLDYGKQDREPGEIVTRIDVPLLKDGEHFGCFKLSKRFDQDISAVCGCFWLKLKAGQVKDARFAYGGMAGIPKRARAAEAAVIGEPWDEPHARAAASALADDFTPLSDMRGSARYRLKAAANLIIKFHLQTTGADVADLYGGAHV